MESGSAAARQPVSGRAWQATNDDMEAMARDRGADGWIVATMPAVHTSPVSRDQGDDPDRYGLVHIIPGNHADAFLEAHGRGAFPDCLAYRKQIEFAVFLVTKFIDPESQTVILIASHYDVRKAVGIVNAVRETGRIRCYARMLDGARLGRFVHEDPEPLLPETAGRSQQEARSDGAERVD